IVVTDDSAEDAQQHADSLGRLVWDCRDQMTGHGPSAAEAITWAVAADSSPVLLLDVGDNIGGGSPGDSVVLPAEARPQGLSGLLSIVQDPAAAAECHRAGVGTGVRLDVGGRLVPGTGPPFV